MNSVFLAPPIYIVSASSLGSLDYIFFSFHAVDKYIIFASFFFVNKFNKSMDLFYSFADDR